MKLRARVLIPLFLCAILLIGGFAAWRASGVPQLAGRLEQEVALARKAGMPVTADELRAKVAVPDSENAAPLIVRALPSFDDKTNAPTRALQELWNLQRYGLTEQEKRQVDKHLAALAPALQQVTEAARLPGLDFKRQWQKGPALELPEFADLGRMMKCLTFRAERSSEGGSPIDALDDVETMGRLGNLVAQEPMIMGHLRANSSLHQALQTLQRVCSQHSNDQAVLRRALYITTSLQFPDPKRAIAGELVLTLPVYRQAAFSSPPSGSGMSCGGLMIPLVELSTVRRAYEAQHVRHWRRLWESVPDDRQDYEGVDRAFQAVTAAVYNDRSLIAQGAGGLLSTWNGYGDAMRQLVARKNLTEAGIRLLLDHPVLPAKLPFDTADPFTGKPLTYRSDGQSFLLYSFDSDRDDDKGMSSAQDRQVQGSDLAWVHPVSHKLRKRPTTSKIGG